MKGLSLLVERVRDDITLRLLSDYMCYDALWIDALSWVNIPLSSRVPRIHPDYLSLRRAYHTRYRTRMKFNIINKSARLYDYVYKNRFSDEYFNDLILDYEYGDDNDENFNIQKKEYEQQKKTQYLSLNKLKNLL